MWYEINVSINGQHFFATAERSITTRSKARDVARLFLKKFPPAEGYVLSVSERARTGTDLDLDNLTSGA